MKKEEREKITKRRAKLDQIEKNENDIQYTFDRVTEVAPEGMTWEGLPDGIKDQIDNAISDFCLYECKPPISDMSQSRAPLWSACCQYIGNTVYKKYKILRNGRNDRDEVGRWVPYDENIIISSIPIWVMYCRLFQKAPFASDFWEFVGASFDWFYNYRAVEVTPARAEISQKLKFIQETGLAGLISDGRGNPTGAIAILNHWHGWSQTAAPQEKTAQNVISVHDLPRLGEISGENGSPQGN